MARFETTHGMRYTSEYKAWDCAKSRCYNPNDKKYPLYGARGIVMCEAWKNSFAAFYRDMGPKPKGLTLDRKDNDGNYGPGNCRWASLRQQNGNRRTVILLSFNGVTLNMAEWSRRTGIPYKTINGRFHRGLSVEDCLT